MGLCYIDSMATNRFDFQPSVLLQFRAQNARSFKDEVSLSMLSNGVSDGHYVRQVPWREGGRLLSVLPAAGVFGANASGKSNLLRVMHDMRSHVLESFEHGRPGQGVVREPFRLDESSRTEPSRYEIDLVIRGVLHRYGFSLNDEQVLEEWAYHYPKGRSTRLFHRNTDSLRLGSAERRKGRAAQDILRPDALFLSTAAFINHPALLPLYHWFVHNLRLVDQSHRCAKCAAALVYNKNKQEAALSLLQAADLGITGLRTVEGPETEYPPGHPIREVRFRHQGIRGDFEIEDDHESTGTLSWFKLVAATLDAMEDGTVMLVDELTSSLHTDLAEELLRLFQEPQTNVNDAQIVFNTHDAQLLETTSKKALLRHDQVWFTEKSNDGSTHLYPLLDFRPPKDEEIRDRYLDGYYGAKPILSMGESDRAIELVTSELRQ